MKGYIASYVNYELPQQYISFPDGCFIRLYLAQPDPYGPVPSGKTDNTSTHITAPLERGDDAEWHEHLEKKRYKNGIIYFCSHIKCKQNPSVSLTRNERYKSTSVLWITTRKLKREFFRTFGTKFDLPNARLPNVLSACQ